MSSGVPGTGLAGPGGCRVSGVEGSECVCTGVCVCVCESGHGESVCECVIMRSVECDYPVCTLGA